MTLIAWPPKGTKEHLNYGIDLTPRLMPNDTVTSHEVSVLSGSIEITSVTRVGAFLTIWIKGGVRGELAKVRGLIETTSGETITLEPVLPII